MDIISQSNRQANFCLSPFKSGFHLLFLSVTLLFKLATFHNNITFSHFPVLLHKIYNSVVLVPVSSMSAVGMICLAGGKGGTG